MAEKRFNVVYDDIVDVGHIHDNEDEKFLKVGALNRTENICDLLNELNSENQELKKENTHLKNELSWIKDYAYWKEKDAFNKLFGYYMITCDEFRIMAKENEQLKQRIKELEIENTAQSDAIDGLQATLTHFDLEEVIK